MKRRKFLVDTALGISGALLYPSLGTSMIADPETIKLTILHTNDTHSRIEPFPVDGSRNSGKGGMAKRAQMIREIRATEKNILLFDSGDIFQGTPYFNFFGGELEMKLMSLMGYDAATMGNHDFDAGVAGFERQLVHAKFPFIVSNYDFSDSNLNGKIEPFKVFVKSNIKVGVYGLGIELKGLVPSSLCEGVVYKDPIEVGNRISRFLKQEMKCDYVICLSHLGYEYKREPNRISDKVYASLSEDVDLILGGHTHTFLSAPEKVTNKMGKPVLINQAGWGGMVLGKIDILFERNKRGTCVSCENLLVGNS